MPPIGWAMGGIEFSNFFLTLKGPVVATLGEAQKAGAVTINYGIFVNAIVNFLIVALALFVLIRGINRLQRPRAMPEVASPTPEDVVLLREIRDLLKAR